MRERRITWRCSERSAFLGALGFGLLGVGARLGRRLAMAAFEAILYGRFWVITEVRRSVDQLSRCG